MRRLIGLLLVLSACATPQGEVPPPADRPTPAQAQSLGYGTPPTPNLAYEFSDTSVSDIQGGPIGAIRVSTGIKGSADLRFDEGSGDNQKVTLSFPEFSGTFGNSAGGGVISASKADIKGQAVLNVSPRGVVTVTSKPEFTTAFRQVERSEVSMYRRFFVRLPARNVRPGATWTDTIASADTDDGLKTQEIRVMRSTYVRDTVVDGRTLAVITSESQRTLDVAGTTNGLDIIQKLKGTSTALTLWDSERRVLITRTESVQLTGTFDLPAMNMTNMPINATGRSKVQLKG
jgi:hypothetical protein